MTMDGSAGESAKAGSEMAAGLIDRFAAIVGDANVIRDAAGLAPHLVEDRGLYKGSSPLLLKPGSTQEVSAILKLASETGTAIVPQTVMTSLSHLPG
jgi:FAD/FMN-containing dehydrogenase